MGKGFEAPTAAANSVQHTMTRQLQAGQCAVNTALNTTHNAHPDIVPYVGIMFSIFSKNPLEILTMELDIQFGDSTDLSVEVYTYGGRYDLVYNDPSVWRMIANTTAVPAPEGGTGVIVPVNEFDTVSMGRMERRSFYITMKSPILDYNVAALAKTNEVALQTPDMDLLVGVGFSEYKFPEAIDPLVDPQFTGVIHYARKAACADKVSTSVDYLFILDEQLRTEVWRDLTRFVDAAVIDIMLQDSGLQIFQEMHDLKKDVDFAQTTTEVYPGNCPPEWDTCSLLLRTTVDFIHDESLSSGELIYSLYQLADTITASVQRKIPDVQVMYIGPRDVAAKFVITLNGVPQGVTMNAAQQEYFSDVTVDFLSAFSAGNSVLDLQVSEQVDNNGSIEVVGKLLGGSYRPAATYVNGLESAFREGRETYIKKLLLDKLRPHAINDIGGTEFFDGIVSVGGRVNIDADAPKPAPVPTQGQEDGGGSSLVLIIGIAAAVGALVLMVLACWYHRTRVISRKEIKMRRALRQEAKKKLLGHDEDHEQTDDSGELVSHTSEGQLTIPAGDAECAEGIESLKATGEEASSPSVMNSADYKGQQTPANEEATQEREQNPTAAVCEKSVKVEEDIPLGSQRRRPPTRACKSFEDNSPGCPPQKRAPTKAAKSLDGNDFRTELGHNRASRKADTASKAPSGAPMGASKAAMARFTKEQPKSSVDNMSMSRCDHHPRGASKAAMSRFTKEQPKSSVDNTSMSRSDHHPRGASKAAMSRFVKEQPKSSVDNISMSRSDHHPRAILGDMFRKIKEAEDVPPVSQQKKAQLQVSKSFEEHLPGGPPPRRAPPKSTKSLDGNEFRSDVVRNGVRYPAKKIDNSSDKPGTASNAPAFEKPQGEPPAAPLEIMNMLQPLSSSPDNVSTSRSVQVESSTDGNAKSKKVTTAGDVSSLNQCTQTQLPPRKSIGDDIHGDPPNKRAQLKATKSFDGNSRRSKLAHTSSVRSLRKINEGSDELGATSNALAFVKLKGDPPAAHASLSKNKFAQYPIPYLVSNIDNDEPAYACKTLAMIDTGPQHEESADSGYKSKMVKEAQGGLPCSQRTQPQFPASKSVEGNIPGDPPKKRAQLKATKSFDGNSRRSKLAHTSSVRSLRKINEGNDGLGATSNAPPFAKPKGDPPAAKSEIMNMQLISSSADAARWSRSVQVSTGGNAKSKKVTTAGDVSSLNQCTQPQLPPSKSIEDDIHGDPPNKRAQLKATKSFDGNSRRSKLAHTSSVRSLRKINEGSDELGTTSNALAFAKPKGDPPAAHASLSKNKFAQYPIPYLVSKIDNDEPAYACKTLTMIDTGPQHEASADSGDKPKTLKEAQGGLSGSHRTQPEFPASKSIEENIRSGPLKKGAQLKATKSFDGNSRRSQLAYTLVRSRRDINEDSDKSRADGNSRRSQFAYTSVRSLRDINEDSHKSRATSNAPAFVKPKGYPPAAPTEIMKAQPSWSRYSNCVQLD